MLADALTPDAERVCILTGASGKLGTAFCRAMADRYAIIAVHNLHPLEVASQVATPVDPLDPAYPLPDAAAPVFAVQADLTRDVDQARLVDVTLARFGRIDVVVNAAAYAMPQPVLDARTFSSSLERHWQMNVVAPTRLVLLVARTYWQDRPLENRRANCSVVNVSSTAGVYVYPGLGHAAYGTSKAALNFLTVHLASELEVMKVRVNAIAPTTFPELVSTDTVVDRIGHLADGDMTGQILVLDTDGESYA
jgi:NAD(P)-dependent dehydrogenase (short-subunit alcohol dehydrogenase family)